MHILLVDPSRTVLRLMRTLLAEQGHEVSMAQDGAMALSIAMARPAVDVLITGLELPSLSGAELCWAARAHAIAERRPIYIIAMSADPSDRKLAEVLDAGADELLQKSMNETILSARLRAAARVHTREQTLIEMATRDPLTDLLNRRGFFERAAGRLEQPAHSAVLVDIDHFKKVNDRYGHDIGDKVIRRVGRHVQTLGELVGRLGGEEFGCLLPGVAGTDALAVCERVRHEIMNDPIEVQETVLWVTVSIGVAEGLPPSRPEETLKRADAGLYRAKAAGRNKSVLVERCDDASMPETWASVRG